MAKKNLIVLGALVLAVGTYTFYYEIPQDKKKSAQAALLYEQRRETIREVTVTSPDGDVTFVNTRPVDGAPKEQESAPVFSEDPYTHWRIKGVADAKVDNGAVGALVQALLSVTLENPIPPSEIESDRALYGLSTPAVTVSVVSAQGMSTISVGKENAYLAKRYAQRTGDENLYLIEPTLFTAATKKKNEYRIKRPFDFTEFDIKEATFTTAAGAVTLAQQDDYTWKITQPAPYAANTTAVTTLLRNIRNLAAVSYHDAKEGEGEPYAAPAVIGTDSFKVAIAFKEASKRPTRTFVVSRNDNSFRGAEVGLRAQYDFEEKAAVEIAKTTLIDLRERRFVKVQPDSVQKVVLQRGADTFSLEKRDDAWFIGEQRADSPFVEGFIKNVAELNAVDFIDDTQSVDRGFATPTATVTLTEKVGDAQPQEVKLVVGARTVDGELVRYAAATGDLTQQYFISEESLKKITPHKEALLAVTPTVTPSPAE